MPTHAQNPTAATSWVQLGVFTQPHGVSGRIKVKSFTEPPEALAAFPELTDEKGTPYALTLTGQAKGMLIVSIKGITNRNQAESLRGIKLGTARAAMPPIEQPDRYYTDDLIGMQVMTTEGVAFGKVAAVVNYGASDILEIWRPDGVQELFAFTHATFPTVNLSERTITIDPPVILSGEGQSETT